MTCLTLPFFLLYSTNYYYNININFIISKFEISPPSYYKRTISSLIIIVRFILESATTSEGILLSICLTKLIFIVAVFEQVFYTGKPCLYSTCLGFSYPNPSTIFLPTQSHFSPQLHSFLHLQLHFPPLPHHFLHNHFPPLSYPNPYLFPYLYLHFPPLPHSHLYLHPLPHPYTHVHHYVLPHSHTHPHPHHSTHLLPHLHLYSHPHHPFILTLTYQDCRHHPNRALQMLGHSR